MERIAENASVAADKRARVTSTAPVSSAKWLAGGILPAWCFLAAWELAEAATDGWTPKGFTGLVLLVSLAFYAHVVNLFLLHRAVALNKRNLAVIAMIAGPGACALLALFFGIGLIVGMAGFNLTAGLGRSGYDVLATGSGFLTVLLPVLAMAFMATMALQQSFERGLPGGAALFDRLMLAHLSTGILIPLGVTTGSLIGPDASLSITLCTIGAPALLAATSLRALVSSDTPAQDRFLLQSPSWKRIGLVSASAALLGFGAHLVL